MKNFWNGQWIADDQVDAVVGRLEQQLAFELELDLPRDRLMKACAKLVESLGDSGFIRKMKEACPGREDIDEALEEVAGFFHPKHLEVKLKRELREPDPELFERVELSEPEPIFEAWAPLGLLIHVAPANALSVGPYTVLEGLLTGNLNLLKVPGDDPPFAALILEELIRLSDGVLAPFIKILSFSSARQDLMRRIVNMADGVAVWGGEEAVASIRDMTSPGVRVIDWGHKISFAYLARGRYEDPEVLEALARDCCLFDQQLCTSPQVVYLECDNFSTLQNFAERFAPILSRVSSKTPGVPMDDKDWAEIATVREIHRREGLLGEVRAEVVEAEDRSWRLLLDERKALAPSPLFRTIWLKRLPLDEIVSTLRPMRRYLQTVGLAAGPDRAALLVRRLTQAGVERITTVGRMLDSYPGEAHDGKYALQRYSRRIGLRLEDWAKRIASLSEIDEVRVLTPPPDIPIMSKQDFQEQAPDPEWAQLYFHSGGSSGAPKLSCFGYEDFYYHLTLGAEGLLAAGLDPASDRCMNLFFAGDLYAGFLCTYVILERLKAAQFPMTALQDYDEVAKTIQELEVNTLLGMPSYIVELFRGHGSQMGSVKKIFFAGEHFSRAQREWLQNDHGVEVIRSVAYGSVDVGFQGYQCTHTAPGVHHLHSRLQTLEILKIDADEPVERGQTGRLVFTSAHRRGQSVVRYEPGDLGSWIDEPCPCGRTAPLFLLKGRHGDVFRIGTNFFNYRVFPELLAQEFGYSGPVQLLLDCNGVREKISMRIETGDNLDPSVVRRRLVEKEPNLRESVTETKLLEFEVQVVQAEDFERSSSSGKLKEVIERRKV